jgi:hypothetical protein
MVCDAVQVLCDAVPVLCDAVTVLCDAVQMLCDAASGADRTRVSRRDCRRSWEVSSSDAYLALQEGRGGGEGWRDAQYRIKECT